MLLLFISALFAGALGAASFTAAGSKLGFADRPVKRSSHRITTPKGGGIGILLSLIVSAVALGIDMRFYIPVVLISLLGLFSDRIQISAVFRLFLHFSLSVYMVILFANFQDAAGLHLIAFALFWTVFIASTANFYNFMDGINGISGLSGVTAFFFLAFFLFTRSGDHNLSLLLICIALACAGFLPFNLPKARVFMGDTGSLLLGFLFAAVVCKVTDSFIDFVVLISFLFPFYADSITTLLLRIKDRENILQSHRRHLYQIFANEMNVPHWKISLGYFIVQVAAGTTLFSTSKFGIILPLSLFAVYSVIFFAVSVHIRRKTGDIGMVKPAINMRRGISKNFIIVLTGDVLLIAVALGGACLFRFGFDIPAFTVSVVKNIFPVVVLIKVTAFAYFDLYKGMWRYAGFSDFFNVVKASVLSILSAGAVTYFVRDFNSMPRAIFVFDLILTIILITSFRFLIRFYFEKINNAFLVSEFSLSNLRDALLNTGEKNFKKLLIIGAGDCGEKIFKEIQSNPGVKFKVVGFVDDNQEKIGKKIHQVPVLNSIGYLPSVIEKTDAEELLIAIPSATSSQMRRIVKICENTGLKFQTIPNMAELINGTVSTSSIRDISFRDLLGRRPIELNHEFVGGILGDKRVLVTGAGGSIGSELCRQISRFKPQMLIMLDNTETLLFEIDYEMKRHFGEIHSVPVLADTQNNMQLEKVFTKYSPEIVFHAAAYKHVTMLEIHPWCAVENNILGTVNIVEVSKVFNVERFVFVSTDKAVRPTSVMGASKRIAEIYVQNQRSNTSHNTKFMTVRFGNVAGSSGSVVSIFKKQIKEGGPVTVTHPDVTRFFMTIPEACQLILQAGAMGNGSEIFFLDMGTSVRIADMAKDMIRLYGYEPEVDIQIEYIGLRKGEKIFEELAANDEDLVKTSHSSIRMLNSRRVSIDNFNKSIDVLQRHAEAQNAEAIVEEFQKIVQDYTPSGITGSEFPPN